MTYTPEQLHRAYERRDWGSGRRTWREVGPTLRKYGRHTKGPSEFTTRALSKKRTKREMFR